MIVLVDDDLGSLDLEHALAEVSPERRAYALGYRFDRDRRLSVAVYLLLKRALREGYGISENPRLACGPGGKPFLPDHLGIHFSLSHCPRAAACVVADFPVGVDVEEIAPVDWDMADKVLSEDELRTVRSSASSSVSFARYWTQKEALVKLSGGGLEEDRLKTLLMDTSGVALETSDRPDRGYVLTVARRIL